jgi:rifampicin phosphotransferase
MSIIRLDEVRKEDLEAAGGKAANLGELIHQGFPVPPGFIIAVDVYAKFVDIASLPGSDEIGDDAESICAAIRYKIISTSLPGEIEKQIRLHHERLQEAREEEIVYAVRSSATAEDLGGASFAGQHDTYYYVGIKNLSMMVKKCWASLWSDAAFSYRQSQGIEHRDVKMAVIVQEMVRSDTSGVTFTADPVSGSDSVIVTESSWGMGAAIVDGRVSPDQFIISKATGQLTAIKIADKKFMVPAFLGQAEVSRLQEVPAHQRRIQSLTLDQVDTITCWAKKSEDYFGSHQDIEWAFHNDEFYILQSRPITIMGQPNDDVPEGKYVLFKPMAENFTDPLLPLSQDIFAKLFPMMAIIHGRVYFNLAYARAMVPLKLTDEDMATFAYLGDVEDFTPRLSIPRLLALLPGLYFCYLTFAVLYHRTSNMPDGSMESFRRNFQRVVDDSNITAPEAMTRLFLKTSFFEPIGNMVLLANITASRYMFLLQLLDRLLKRWLPNLRDDAASLLSSGNEGVLSTEMGREIWHLARTIRNNESLSDIVLQLEPDKALATLRERADAAVFMEQLQLFLNKHGHRALKEFELNSVRWDEDPSPLLAMIRNYLLADADPEASEARVEQQRLALLQEVKDGLAGLALEKQFGLRFRIIAFVRNRARYFIKLRENSRFYHIMGFYAVRKKILQTENTLMENGTLKCKDDIFYLKWHEVRDLLSGSLTWADVEDLIRSRRMNYIRLCKKRPPKTIGIDIARVNSEAVSGNQLSGQGASPGSCQGKARIIMDPGTDAEIRPGEILVAPYTDPAWTPLFLTANAAVIEVGSYLSHAGTIAREYGMPCVVDVPDCTSRITSGDMIHVDGSNGTVTLLNEPVAEVA